MTDPAQVQLLACYELGHQPLSIAWPLAFLQQEGILAQGHDLSVENFPTKPVLDARFVGISVPMHTALRLGVQVAKKVRKVNPNAHISFLGHYAQLNAKYLLHGDNGAKSSLADSVLSGEYEEQLVKLVKKVTSNGSVNHTVREGPSTEAKTPHLKRLNFPLPDRRDLPHLSNYSRFVHKGVRRLAGYVEATRGCLHTCRHCPVVPIYNGRFFIVQIESVLADIRQQVQAGAQHITFGDPDFLNGPGHSHEIAERIHREFPSLTFDFTTKVEHIVEKQQLIGELKRLGAAFVVSAFESTSDRVLRFLKKGHSRKDLDLVVSILNQVGLPVQPTWVPFTPWTELDDYLDMLNWVRTHGLEANIPPVQYSIRLLVPPNSALITAKESREWFGPLKAEAFVHEWAHQDPRMDQLQGTISAIAETAADSNLEGFLEIEREAYTVAERPLPEFNPVVIPASEPPRLTEDWFC